MNAYHLLLVVPLLLGVLCACAVADDPVAPPAQRTFRIMPVGDSITEGSASFSCYRYPLWQLLTKAGYAVQYVGSKKSESPNGPMLHEGYGGKNTEYLASIIEEKFRETPADIVLLHSGHNHAVEQQPVPGIVKATESIITAVRKVNPQVVVLLAQVIPSGKLPKYSYIPQLNEELAKLAARLNTPEQPFILVNQADGFDWTTDTIADHVHPNAQGAEKMAARWFAALRPILQPTATPPVAIK